VSQPWTLCEVPLDLEVPTVPTLRLLATLRRRQLASGLIEWLAGRAVLRRLAITEHRPGMIRLIDRAGADAGSPHGGGGATGRGWPFAAEEPRWSAIDRQLVLWLHGNCAGALRVALVQHAAEACVLFSGEAGSAYAIHASRNAEVGGFPDDELRAWATAAVLLRQVIGQRPAARPPLSMAERIDRADALLQVRTPSLSPREREVVARIACGITNDGIAADLGLSSATVLTLRRRAYAKLRISSCVQLTWLVD
jgi:DNA-binding CsgD family transcriptional regulator